MKKINFPVTLPPAAIILTILFFVLWFSPPPAAAQLPMPTAPLENRLFQGTNEDIAAFIHQRLQQIEDLSTEVNQLTTDASQGNNAGNEAPESVGSSLKDFYQGVAMQYKSLLAEIFREPPPIEQAPVVSSPHYSVSDCDQVIIYLQQASLQSGEIDQKLELNSSRLEALKNQAAGRLAEYAKLSKNNQSTAALLYQQYGELLSLQCEYALLERKNPKLEKHLQELEKGVQSARDWLSKSFSQIRVEEKDLSQAQDEFAEAEKQFQETFSSSSAEYQDLNRRIVLYEAQLDASLAKINENQSNEVARAGWLIEKDRIELIIQSLKLRLNLINQRHLKHEVLLRKADFRQSWLKLLQNPDDRQELKTFLSRWSDEKEGLERRLSAIGENITGITQIRSNQTLRLVGIQKREESSTDASLRKALQVLLRQEAKVTENLDKLLMALVENEQEIRDSYRKLAQIIDLVKLSASYRERLSSWSRRYLSGFKERILSVIYYPLFSFGSSTIDLQVILKVLVLFIAGIILLRRLRNKLNQVLQNKAALSPGAINSITTLGYYASLLIVTTIILSSAGLDLSQLSIILGALGVGIGFGLQTITNNFISGIILLSEQSVKVGDIITLTDGLIGTVRRMSIRTTVVRTFDGEDVIVPNSDLISNRVNTWTYGDDWRRINIPFGVSYDSDPDEVVRLAEEAAREVSLTREDFMHPLKVFFEGFGDNSLDFSIRVWCRLTNLNAPAGLKTEYYFALFRKFKEAGITIPFPQRDLHLQSMTPEMTSKLAALMAVNNHPALGPENRPEDKNEKQS